jgi:putative ABC transport system ATP-binding protein
MLKLSHIYKRYSPQGQWVLEDFSFNLQQGETVAIVGESGRGKTTLINIIGLLDDDFDGQYCLMSNAVTQCNKQEKTEIRNRYFGFVFQSALLIPHLNVMDNIGLPLYYQGLSPKEIKSRVMRLLEKFKLLDLSKRLPKALSGGQKQRVSILRALIHQPKCIIADEPTSQLDMATQNTILDEIFSHQQQTHCSMIFVTHQPLVAKRCERIVDMT